MLGTSLICVSLLLICLLSVFIMLMLLYLNTQGTNNYAAYLRDIYAKHNISSGGKWPTVHLVKNFVNLAIVSHTSRDTNEIINYVLPGNIDKMLEGKESIELEDILKPTKNGGRVSLVLVEGAPGIGKSTLAWELCRRWNDIPDFKKFSLVVLHRFRDNDTQKISQVRDLFPHEDERLQDLVLQPQ